MLGQEITIIDAQSAVVQSSPAGAVGREDLADAVYRSTRSLTRLEARALVDDVLTEIAYAIEREGRVSLSGFGLFTTSRKGARVGRNPKTGELYPIEPRTVVRFAAAIGLRKQVAQAHLAATARTASTERASLLREDTA